MPIKPTIGGRSHRLFQATTLSLFLILAVLALTIGSSGAYASGASASDAFGRTITGGWGAADTGGTYALTGTSADFSVDGSEGVMVLAGTGSTNQRVVRLSSVSAMNVDGTVRMAVSSLPTSTWHIVYMIARRVSSGNEYRARIRIDPAGGVHLQASVLSGGVESFLGSEVTVAGLAIAPGVFFNVHFRITGANPSTLLIRSWADGASEPASWDYSIADSNSTTQAAGSIGIVSRAGSNVPVSFLYDDFLVMNSDEAAATATATLAPPRTPTPTNAPATATSTGILLNTATPTKTPADTATPSNTAAPTATASASAPTATPVGAWALAFAPQADAYINASFPINNYGTSTSLRLDANPINRAYIRFAPVNLYGASITRARLRLYVNTASSAGIQALTVGNNTWGETSITYNNAPPIGSTLGSISPVSKSTWVTLDVTSYVAAPGTYSLGVITSDTRVLSLSSRESGSHAPQLILDLFGGTPPTATPTRTATPVPPTPTSTNTPLPSTSTPTVAPTPTGSPNDPVVVGAGDIACGTGSTGSVCLQQGTANLILQINPAAVLPLGDNQYEQGALADFNAFYDPAWGAFRSITHPSVGNHEYGTTGAQGYFDYFNGVGNQTGPAGDRTKGYYSYNVGAWHLIVLNTDCSLAGGCNSGSPQDTWLRADLSANAGKCLMAYSHFPMFSSGQQPHNSGVNTLFQDLYNAHGDIYLAGHDHDYERFYPSDPTGAITSAGILQFVVGTGGRNMTSLSSNGLAANSAVFNSNTFGVIKFTLHATSYDWVFLPAASTAQFRNGTFTDSGSATCHLGH